MISLATRDIKYFPKKFNPAAKIYKIAKVFAIAKTPSKSTDV